MILHHIYTLLLFKNNKKIAEQLKIKEEKVKSRLFRIRRKLKKSLEKRVDSTQTIEQIISDLYNLIEK